MRDSRTWMIFEVRPDEFVVMPGGYQADVEEFRVSASDLRAAGILGEKEPCTWVRRIVWEGDSARNEYVRGCAKSLEPSAYLPTRCICGAKVQLSEHTEVVHRD